MCVCMCVYGAHLEDPVCAECDEGHGSELEEVAVAKVWDSNQGSHPNEYTNVK